jgi:hypothetical protein
MLGYASLSTSAQAEPEARASVNLGALKTPPKDIRFQMPLWSRSSYTLPRGILIFLLMRNLEHSSKECANVISSQVEPEAHASVSPMGLPTILPLDVFEKCSCRSLYAEPLGHAWGLACPGDARRHLRHRILAHASVSEL